MAADPGKIRKVNKQVVTQDAPTPEDKKAGTASKVGAAADKVVAKMRAKKTAQISVNLNPQLGTGV